MSTNRKSTNLGILEKSSNAVTNVESHPDIARKMAERGFTSEELDKGKNLLTLAQEAYYRSKKERDELRATSKNKKKQWELFKQTFSLHRQIAKVACRKDEVAAAKLSVDGPAPKIYLEWIDEARKFYTEALASEEFKKLLAALKLSEEELIENFSQIKLIEASKSLYLKQKAKSENATDAKKKAFKKMDDWMSDFYAVAKIAFMDQPQLQEALGKVVKS